MPYIEILFYIVCLGQIFLLSIYYPIKIIKRVDYILLHYPATDYPKFYPTAPSNQPEQVIRGKSNFFKLLNFIIAVCGIGILLFALFNDFRLNEKGGAEIFVVMFMMVQFTPHAMMEIYQAKHYKHMRTLNTNTIRHADLTPRHIFDFISIKIFYLALGLYALHLVTFLYYSGNISTWDEGVWITLIVGTIINVGFIAMSLHFVKKWKLDPHQAEVDKILIIKTNVRVLAVTSILMSLFFIIINTVREFGLDIWEPILMSLYFQALIVFGMGFLMNTIKVQDLDFSVYKD